MKTWNSEINSNLSKGLFSLYKEKLSYAERFFFSAIKELDPVDPQYALAQSYQGLTQILRSKRSGLMQCYSSIKEQPEALEIQLNLAIAEMLNGNRKRSLQVINKISTGQINNNSKMLVDRFYNIIGKREENHKGNLKRNTLIHRLIGKSLRKRKAVNQQELKQFVKKLIELNHQYAIQQP
jgi:hypothetical protein